MRYRCVDQVVQRHYSVNFSAVRKGTTKKTYCIRKVQYLFGESIRLASGTASTAEGPKLPKVTSTDHMRSTAKFRDLVSLLWKVVEEKRVTLINPLRNITTTTSEQKVKFDVSEKIENNTSVATSVDLSRANDEQLGKVQSVAPKLSKYADLTLFDLARKLPSYFAMALKIRHSASAAAQPKPPASTSKSSENVPNSDLAPKQPPPPPPAEVPSPHISAFKRAEAWTSRENADSRTRYLLRSVAAANSLSSRSTRIQEFCRHLYNNPQAKSIAVKEKGIPMMLRLRLVTKDPAVQAYINEALALLGYIHPLPGRGIRILSIDGGGIRGIMAIEILRALEQITKQPVHLLFDYMCGVSTGAILTMLLGALKMSMDECEEMYKQTSTRVFTQSTWWGTGQLVLSHAYYDTATWSKALQQSIGEMPLIQTARDPTCPKIASISTIVNQPRLLPFIFRNYDYPIRRQSAYPGMYTPQLWEAVRASAAAPGYFEEYPLGDYVHQDGGVLNNNPSALAIHECRHLWPNESIQCMVSIGNGRYEPQVPGGPTTTSSLKTKLLKIVDSATDTEAVHTILGDLLPPSRYYRFNPYLSAAVSLDEIRPEKFRQLHDDSLMYLRKNEHKLEGAAEKLVEARGPLQKLRDNVKLKFSTYV